MFLRWLFRRAFVALCRIAVVLLCFDVLGERTQCLNMSVLGRSSSQSKLAVPVLLRALSRGCAFVLFDMFVCGYRYRHLSRRGLRVFV